MRRRTFLVTTSGICSTAFWRLPSAATERSAPPGARKAPTGPGTPVVVTKEMLGAGIVSSGVALPPIPKLTGNRAAPVPSWGQPLPFPVVIADRRNNRLIEVTPDMRGSAAGYLNYPDDAHILDDGMLLTADIRNCRVLIVDPVANKIVTEWGAAGPVQTRPAAAPRLPEWRDADAERRHHRR